MNSRRRIDPVSLMIWPGALVFLFGMLILGDKYPELGVATILIPFFTWWTAVVVVVFRNEPIYKHWRVKIEHEDTKLEAESVKVRGYSPRNNQRIRRLLS